MASALGALASGVGQILGRTVFLQPNTATGIPVPLVVLDVVKTESVEYETEISEHPVEAGPEVGDHAQRKNPTIRLKGTISNTPLDLSTAIANVASGALAAISTSQARSNLLNSAFSQAQGIVGSVLQGNASNLAANAAAGAVDAISRTILLNAYESSLPFTVLTRRQRFDNVIIKKLHFPRDEDTGYALEFEIDLKQIRIVNPLVVQKNTVDEAVISGASSSTNLGNQSTQSTSAQLQNAVQGSTLGQTPGVVSKSPAFFSGVA